MADFLYVPGDENDAGPLRTLVLTILENAHCVYWVVRYKSEDARSRLIQELKTRVDEKRMTEIVSAIRTVQDVDTKQRQETAREVKLTEPALTVKEALVGLTGPCLLGVQKKKEDA